MNTTSPCAWPSPEKRIRDPSGVPSLMSFDCVTTSWRICVFYPSTEAVKLKKVHCSRGTKRSFVWRHGRFRGREDTRTPWSRRDESHAPFPSRYNDDTAGHCDLAPPCNTGNRSRETTLRINAMPKTEKTEGLVRISVHRFHTDSHREMLVADLLRFGTQRPAEVDGGSFRSEGIGKRLRQGLRLLWMAPRSQNYYHNNR